MSQDKYLAASRGLRASTLLLATTVATVLQALPQALGIEQYRNLRKAVDGLQKADAEMAELEDELSAKLSQIETEVKPVTDQSGGTSEDEPARRPAGRANKTESTPASAAAEIKADDAKTEGAAPDQASLNV